MYVFVVHLMFDGLQTNSADPDQAAPVVAVRSRYTLFASMLTFRNAVSLLMF